MCRCSGRNRGGTSAGSLLSNNADAQGKVFTADTSTFPTAWGSSAGDHFPGSCAQGSNCPGVLAGGYYTVALRNTFKELLG